MPETSVEIDGQAFSNEQVGLPRNLRMHPMLYFFRLEIRVNSPFLQCPAAPYAGHDVAPRCSRKRVGHL